MNTPTMRAKMKVESVKRQGEKDWPQEVVKLNAVCRSTAYPADGGDEDNTFAKFSPQAALEITIANPALHGKINPGDVFYVDFTKVE